MTPPVKPEEQKPPEGGGNGAADAFDRGKLNPILRDMSPEQINDLLETMSSGLRASREAAAAAPTPTPEPKKVEVEQVDVKDLMNPQSDKYDPEKALDYVVRKNYGQAVADIGTRSLEGVFLGMRTEFADFKDYEPEIRRHIAKADPTTVNQEVIASLYLQAKGLKITRAERAEAAKKAGAGTVAPSPPEAPKKEVELSAVEVEVANRMFRRAADPVAEYKKYLGQLDGGPMTLKVPVGDGKKE